MDIQDIFFPIWKLCRKVSSLDCNRYHYPLNKFSIPEFQNRYFELRALILFRDTIFQALALFLKFSFVIACSVEFSDTAIGIGKYVISQISDFFGKFSQAQQFGINGKKIFY